MANYNNAGYVEEAITSVFNQTYEDWEIILVDDCSTDCSGEIVKNYENRDRVQIYYNKENKGCGYTKGRCIEIARGDICGFLDPDDVLREDALEIMVEEHIKYPDAGLIYSTYYGCDKNLNPEFIPPWVGEFRSGENQLTATRISAFATFKKKDYEKTEGINPKLKRAVDQDLYFKLEEVTETHFVNKPLYYYRKHEDSISTFDNRYRAKYWHLVAAFNACERRGISKEDFFKHYLEKHDREISVKDTKEYKLGKFLLHPIRKLYQKIK